MNNSTDSPSSSKRQLLTSKAINLSSKLLTKSATYLSSRDLDLLANPINRVNGIVSKPNRSNESHLKHRSIRSWDEWDQDTSNWNMVVGGQPVPENGQPSRNSVSQTPPANSSGSSYLSYFHPQNWQRKNKESPYVEDHLVCFPGFVALVSPSHARAGDIELFISIHAFKARSSLDNMNRSQRLVYSMICKMTGLPPLSSTTPGSTLSENNLENVSLIEDELMGWDEEQNEKMRSFEPLLPSSNKTTDLPNQPTDLPSNHQSLPSHPTQQLHTLDTRLVSQPDKIICTAPTPVRPNMPCPLPFTSNTVSRSSSTSSTKSYRRIFQQEEYPSHEIRDTGMGRLMEKFHIEKEDLHTLHFNLKERLHSFFSQKAESSKVRLKLYGICSSKATSGSIRKSLFRSRIEPSNLLTPELAQDEFVINNGRPLLTQVITTKSGGVWSDKLVLPWQTIETHLRVHQMQQNDHSANLSRKSTSQSPDTGIIRVRIEAELIKDETNYSYPRITESLSDHLSKDQLRKLSVGQSSLTMELDVIPALAESVHVISDIDDTIKSTNVLGGLKCVLKNVFLAGFDQVAIAGMAEWYQSLQELGCWIHYISNSPLELWYCIEGFLSANGFPRGSMSLKEYARGATSILSGIWESAGSRKRARVESIIKQFPKSKFICIGDSGEQDLEMYVSLAQAYPCSIISIYIRDVTTPAILGKDICIDQVSAPDCLSFEWDDDMRPPTQIGTRFLSTPRSSSPSRQDLPTHANRFESKSPQLSKSCDLSSQPQQAGRVPSEMQTSQKPMVPPKPVHLSSNPPRSKPLIGNRKRLSQIERFQNQNLGNLDPAIKDSRSKSIDIARSQQEGYFGLEQDCTPSTTPTANIKPSCEPTSAALDDVKIQSLLEAFRNRVKKAESELNQLHFIHPPHPGHRLDNHHDQSYPSYRDRSLDQPDRSYPQPVRVGFTSTKLRLFRCGLDDCVAESIVDVKKLLNK
ncbi:uncharacterized protein VP01_225g11 [Puccinia sorghi]|uniref:Phosphatidate phosphatase APP1 catalytic domain-containing protein n=1 Tax=Puccinia sorghi TaxID=27349 RepID=A0A0L6V8D2_9BASI|nr:uncharacterized protein VP01_225g11 [Puccinia sorghi]